MVPSDIQFHRLSRTLTLEYDTGETYSVSAGFLRMHSSSAESGYSEMSVEQAAGRCRSINIVAIDAVGNYALRLGFDDGHDSGIYTWAYLYDLVTERWREQSHYFNAAKTKGGEIDAIDQQSISAPVVQLFDPRGN